jgi:DNA-binding transcriptional MerR regulator
MRISELSRTTGMTVATIKYYIREGLLPAGTPVSATQAEYDRTHVDRLRLIRALVDVGRLSITTVRELLATLDAPQDGDPADRVATAVATAHQALSPRPPAGTPPPERALAAMATLGWQVDPESASLRELENALAGLDAVQLAPSEATLRTYADAALTIAEVDVTGVPSASPAETVRYVVIGTVMYEPVLIALRRLAQQHVFREGPRPPDPGSRP